MALVRTDWISTAAASCNYSTITPQTHLSKLQSSSLSWVNHRRRRRVKISSAATPTPWLMLPPLVEEGGAFNYRFYSLEEEKVLTFRKGRRGCGGEIPPDDAKIVGTSRHGWLALFDDKSNHVFLTNPISDRHVKLPAVDTLPDPHINLFEGRGTLSRVVISGPPPLEQPDKEWGAMMTFGPGGRPALCSYPWTTWRPVEQAFQYYTPSYSGQHVKFARRPYHDLAIHGGEFTSIQPCAFELRKHGLFARDKHGRGEKHCQMIHWLGGRETFVCRMELRRWEEEMGVDEEMLERECTQMPHLVWAPTICATNPLIVMRFVNLGLGRILPSPGEMEGYSVSEPISRARSFPAYSTVFFLVLKIERGEIHCEVVDDLKGLALFIGMNHAFVVPATGKLKPDSIYFTDAGRIDRPSMGHDVGVFDYRNKTVSPCYYPDFDTSSSMHSPPPIWFTPN